MSMNSHEIVERVVLRGPSIRHGQIWFLCFKTSEYTAIHGSTVPFESCSTNTDQGFTWMSACAHTCELETYTHINVDV